MKDPYWTYIDKLRGQIDELKAGVDFYEEVLRLRAETIDLHAIIDEQEKAIEAFEVECDEADEEMERMQIALHKLADIHDRSPSGDWLLDSKLAYARKMLFEAREIARAALELPDV